MSTQQSGEKPEVVWTKQYLLPLVRSMSVLGIIDVQYHGGASERGKDITFSYRNPLGFPVHCAIQVKYPRVTGKASDLEQLRGEIHAAFEQPFKRAPNELRYVHQLYLVAPDGFTNEAKVQIGNIPDFAQRSIVYVDQSRLDQWKEMAGAALTSGQGNLGSVVNYALVEIRYAIEIADMIKLKPRSMIIYRLDFLERLIAMPFKDPQISGLARKAWFLLRSVNEMALAVNILAPINGGKAAQEMRLVPNQGGKDALIKLRDLLTNESNTFQTDT